MSRSAPDSEAGGTTVPDPADEQAPPWEAVVGAIGPRVRELRQASGLSLQQLARRADVSAAAIHKVERAEMVPTITTLLKIAAALRQPLSHFVADPALATPVAALVQGDARPALPALPGVRRSRVSGPASRFRLRGAMVEIEPGAGDEPAPVPGEDLVVVQEGTLAITVGGEHHVLEPGDALHYPTDHPVRRTNPGSSTARALWFSVPPDGVAGG